MGNAAFAFMSIAISKLNIHLRIADSVQGEWLYQLITETTIVGRDGSAQLRIPNNMVSRSHCSIRVVLDTVPWIRVADLGSTNGTHLNGQLLTGEETFSEKDILEIGNTIIRIDVTGFRTRAIPVQKVEISTDKTQRFIFQRNIEYNQN